MKQFSTTQMTLLQILGDGLCHSGNELGQCLGVTRTAVWKQITHLIDLGVPIQRLPQQGYQLPNQLILLDEQKIKNHLSTNKITIPFNLHLFPSINSTNHYLKELPNNTTLDICCSEQQTQGRGRFGRHWHSPFGENIYCSSRWTLDCNLSKLSGLSLVTSLAVLATINEFYPSPDIKIKWPNDIFWQNKKLCGSLIEIIAESNGNAQVIIGIGLNVNSDTKNQPLPDKPWCSLYEISNQYFDRNEIIAKLILHLHSYLDLFLTQGFNAFMEEWNKADYLFGKRISITQFAASITGIASGVNLDGQLILDDESGIRHYLSSGDTTLR